MKKLTEFIKNNKYAVIWTLCYIAVVYLVLSLLFGFNIFSARQWSLLFHAQLRGFPGFVFGLLMLSAVPLYIATTCIIVRTKKPLFVLYEKKKPAPKEEKKTETAIEQEKPLPTGIPSELRGAFARARRTVNERVVSDFEMKDMTDEKPAAPVVSASPEPVPVGLPLPDNFDFSAPDTMSESAPVFREISFGEPTTDSVSAVETMHSESELHRHLKDRGCEIKTDGNITIANGMAIALHDDSDFWIADDDNWFAAGKQKSSPIAEAIAIAQHHNISPAIYLAEKNIMDLDAKTAEWEKNGVRVVKKLSDI